MRAYIDIRLNKKQTTKARLALQSYIFECEARIFELKDKTKRLRSAQTDLRESFKKETTYLRRRIVGIKHLVKRFEKAEAEFDS